MSDSRELEEIAKTLTFAEYEYKAGATAIYPGKDTGCILYPLVSMVEELGELIESIFLAIDPDLSIDCFGAAVASKTLYAAMALGKVAGGIKKAHRNGEDGKPGLMSETRVDRMRAAALELDDDVTALRARLARFSGSGAFDSGPVPFLLPDTPDLSGVDVGEVAGELGGMIWYQTQVARMAGTTLAMAAAANNATLASRMAAGTIAVDSAKRS